MDLKLYPNFKKHYHKNMLAIDYGKKVTGFAIFCPKNDPFPIPYKKTIYKGDEQLIKEVLDIINNENINLVILGLPLLLDGQATSMTETVKGFGDRLKKELNNTVEFHYQDETLTTYEAKNRMKNSPYYNFKVDPKKIDMLSAVIIMEDFIKEAKK